MLCWQPPHVSRDGGICSTSSTGSLQGRPGVRDASPRGGQHQRLSSHAAPRREPHSAAWWHRRKQGRAHPRADGREALPARWGRERASPCVLDPGKRQGGAPRGTQARGAAPPHSPAPSQTRGLSSCDPPFPSDSTSTPHLFPPTMSRSQGHCPAPEEAPGL